LFCVGKMKFHYRCSFWKNLFG